MNEIIIKIEETTFQIHQKGKFDGYEITTNKQIIQFGIDNCQRCCESWGYFSSEDNLNEFIGAELLDIQLTDTALNTKKLFKMLSGVNFELGIKDNIMFVTFKTNKGFFQLTAYNGHNGYYGHDAVIISQQLTEQNNL